MINSKLYRGLLSGNQLKLIAAIAMTSDHIGKQLLPEYPFLQVFGRIAYPIFAYMLAEGCRYTRNTKKHLQKIAVVALICQLVYSYVTGSVYQSIMVTFTLSVLLIYIIEKARRRKTKKNIIRVFTGIILIYILTEIMPLILKSTDFGVDYGFLGVLYPVVVFLLNKKTFKLIGGATVLVLMSCFTGGIQWYSLLAILLLMCYNGKRGKKNFKNLFYIYYPAHLAVIYLINLI